MGFIAQLYFGNINPQTRYVKSGSATSRAMKTLSESEERLRQLLNAEELKLFEAYDEAWAKVLGDSCLDSFVEGFRLGARFVFDAFISDDAPFYGNEQWKPDACL